MATMTNEKNLAEKHFYEEKTIIFFDEESLGQQQNTLVDTDSQTKGKVKHPEADNYHHQQWENIPHGIVSTRTFPANKDMF